jgi:hypothetical protein
VRGDGSAVPSSLLNYLEIKNTVNVKDLVPEKPGKYYFYQGEGRLGKNSEWEYLSGVVGVAENDTPDQVYRAIVLEWKSVIAKEYWDGLMDRSGTTLDQLKERTYVTLNRFERIT